MPTPATSLPALKLKPAGDAKNNHLSFSTNEQTMGVLSGAFSNDGNMYAAATAKGTVFVLQTVAPDGSHLAAHSHAWAFNPGGLSDSAAASCFRFRPNGAEGEFGESSFPYLAAVTLSTGSLGIWSLNPQTKKATEVVNIYEPRNETLAVAWTADGNSLVTGGSDRRLRRYALDLLGTGTATNTTSPSESPTTISPSVSPTTKKAGPALNLVTEFKQGLDEHGRDTLGPNNRVFSIKFLPDSNDVFLTAGWESPVLVYDCRHGVKPVAAFHGPHVSGDALDVDNNVVAVGSERHNDQLQYFDVRKISGAPTPAPHADPALLFQTTLPGRVFSLRFAKSSDETLQKRLTESSAVWCAMSEANGVCLAANGHNGAISHHDTKEAIFVVEQNPSVPEYVTISGAKGFLEPLVVG